MSTLSPTQLYGASPPPPETEEKKERVKPKLAIVTTCMGRLDHLKMSSEILMKDERVGKEIMWVLVDYACPQNSGEWVTEAYGDRVEVLRIDEAPIQPGEPERLGSIFNKPLALNSGAMTAIGEGAEYLAFMDADTLVTEAFLDYVLGAMSLDNYLIIQPYMEKKDLTGFLCLNHRHFLRAGGYDPAFKGWGAEDLEMRLKLLLKAKLPYSEIPYELAGSIPHADQVRTMNYEEKNKDSSHNINLNLLCTNAFGWTGEHLLDLYNSPQGPAIRRLLGIEPNNPLELL